MDEIQINGGDSLGDEFYEKIEAPKFVDLKALDRYRPDNDDRYWFCLRVGCDQKHEDEMDSEAIYKNFVLRVMAARSPNVRLRKALYGKDPSANSKCPLTVPAKSSKSRVSRLALVSSISQKMVDGKRKGRALFKQLETPKKKEKQSSVVVSKALTTPRNKKSQSNLGAFRSVRNPNPPAIAVPKNKMVAKALVFNSPKKTLRMNLKKSTELSVRKLCGGMKKLEITNGKNDIFGSNKPVLVDSSRKRFRGREVKSRVFDSLRPQNCQGKEAKFKKCLKKKDGELQQHCVPAPCVDSENDSSDMEIEEKSRNGSIQKCSRSGTSKGEKGNEHEDCPENKENLEFQLGEDKDEAISDTSSSELRSIENSKEKNTGDGNVAYTRDQNGESKPSEGSESVEQVKFSPDKGSEPNVVKADENENENENVSVSDDKENECEDMKVDVKENALASIDYRTPSPNVTHTVKKKLLSKHETSKGNRTVTKGMTKTPKRNSTAAVNCAEGASYRKPKLTNPKPFRLRTDERQILKETNLEKKLHLEPLKETTTKRIYHNAVQRNEKCHEQTECASNACKGSEKKSDRRTGKNQPQQQRRGTSCPQTSKAEEEQKESTTPQATLREFNQEKVAEKSEETLKRTKSLRIKRTARTRGIEPSKKITPTPTTPGQLGVIKESSPTILRTMAMEKPQENGSSPATKASTSASRPSFLGRKPVTIPKEPHFHNVHVPKSCTRRVT